MLTALAIILFILSTLSIAAAVYSVYYLFTGNTAPLTDLQKKISDLTPRSFANSFQRLGHFARTQRQKRKTATLQKKVQQRVEDTRKAQEHLKIAHTYLEKLTNNLNHDVHSPELWRPLLAATKHITDARALDPTVTYVFLEAKPGDIREWSCDQLATWALFIQAIINSHHNLVKPSWEEGLKAIDKAIAYFPQRSHYHLQRAVLLSRLCRRKEAYKAVLKAMETDPNDFDAIQMRDRFDADPLIGVKPVRNDVGGTLIILSLVLGLFGIYLVATINGTFLWVLALAAVLYWYGTSRANVEDIERRLDHDDRMAGKKGPHEL